MRTLEALANSTNDVLLGNNHVLEGDHASVRAALAHVDFLASGRDTWGVGVNDEAGQALDAGGRVRNGEDELTSVTVPQDPSVLTLTNQLAWPELVLRRLVLHNIRKARYAHPRGISWIAGYMRCKHTTSWCH